jgi:hypothetical protein
MMDGRGDEARRRDEVEASDESNRGTMSRPTTPSVEPETI